MAKTDFKSMYYHLAGHTAGAVDTLEVTINALRELADKLRMAQQTTEEMFIGADDDDDPESAE